MLTFLEFSVKGGGNLLKMSFLPQLSNFYNFRKNSSFFLI